MFETYAGTLCFLCPVIFIAMFIDSNAGGGGIITVPAYLLTGLPITTVYGTNKFVACLGTAFGAGNYIRKKYVNWTIGIPALLGALIGSFLGAELTLHLSQDILQVILVIILPLVAICMIFNRNFGEENENKSVRKRLSSIFIGFFIGLFVGCYDGFFGPGAGMFYTLAFVLLERSSLIYATGTTKVVNLASNFSALIAYLVAGSVNFKIAIPCTICSITGCLLGSHFAIKKGTKFIKIIIIIASMLLLLKIIIDMIK